VLSGTAPDLTYTPNAGYSGPDSFSFTVNDGTVDSAPADATITVNPAPGFDQWFANHGLSGSPSEDHDGDNIPTSIEYVIGGNPANHMDTSLLPTMEMVAADPDEDLNVENYLLFTYRRTDLADSDSSAVISVEWNTMIDNSWSSASGTPGVVILADDDAADTGVDLVRVYLPLSLAGDGKLCARLNVVIANP
jgi:hypothetical protein